MKNERRLPRGFKGTSLTIRKFSDVLPNVLSDISRKHTDRPDLIIASWPLIVGPKIGSMTKAVSFSEGFLRVNVKNSTLFHLLAQTDKPKILRLLKQKFPAIEIKDIFFRMG